MNKITTVIFDIGNVLMRFTWKDYVERLFGEAKRRNDRQVVSILRNVVC